MNPSFYRSNKLPMPPSKLPSSLDCVPSCGEAAITFSASLLKGKLCIHTSPGPVKVAKNNPSPPNNVFFNPPTN